MKAQNLIVFGCIRGAWKHRSSLSEYVMHLGYLDMHVHLFLSIRICFPSRVVYDIGWI